MPRKTFTWVVLSALVVVFVGVLGVEVLGGGGLPAARPLGPVTLGDLLFYLFALMTVGGAAMVASSRSIVYSSVGLLAALSGAGALYVFLSADFLAITQLLVYIGGVLVLILFAVMLTSRISDVKVSNTSLGVAGGVALLACVAPVLLFIAVATPWPAGDVAPLAATTQAVGDGFLSRWLLPFELASLVLLATLIGAVVIARKELKRDEPEPS